MKTRKTLFMLIAIAIGFSLHAQETGKKTHITGYINAVAEWTDAEYIDQAIFNPTGFMKDYAIGLSEFGLLATFKPNEKLEFKSTLVYTHFTFHVSQIFVEAYGKYSFSDMLQIGAGRFLTPLSPVNLYFYAPLNPSGVVPMLVSHHFMFPQSISGFQVQGETDFGLLKFGYAGSIGSYPYINHFEAGVLGLQAQEDAYSGLGYYDTSKDKINNYLCGTGRAYSVINDAITLGANLFVGDAQQVENVNGGFKYYPSSKYTYGVDLHLDYYPFKVNAEYWAGEQKTTEEGDKQLLADGLNDKRLNSYTGYYGEIIYNHDVFKPFVRYDYIKDITIHDVGFPATTITAGIAIRPIFETLIKLEYKTTSAIRISDDTRQNIHYLMDGDPLGDPTKAWTSKNVQYNYLQLSFVLSF
jgi:hypothetical protein